MILPVRELSFLQQLKFGQQGVSHGKAGLRRVQDPLEGSEWLSLDVVGLFRDMNVINVTTNIPCFPIIQFYTVKAFSY